MSKQLEPRWKDGKIDPDWLGGAGLRFAREWLATRLAGVDALVPLDPRVDEDPEALFVDLLREVGAHHPAFDVVARAALQLLDQARRSPALPPYFGNLIRLCQRTRLPQTSTWFSEELSAIARDVGKRNEREGRWGGYEGAKEILYAAAVQCPGHAGSASRPAWERLLSEPRFATIAFVALSQTFADRVAHLGKWWVACQVDEREREIEYMIGAALRTEGETHVRDLLREHEASLPRDLKEAIDHIFRLTDLREVFVPTRRDPHMYQSAIEGAGLQRRYLISRHGQTRE